MRHRKRNRRLKRRQKSRLRKDLSGPSRQRCVVDFDSRSCRRPAPVKSRLTFMVEGGLDLASESFAERATARHNILNRRLKTASSQETAGAAGACISGTF